MRDLSAVGCTGVITVATRGEDGPGEVQVALRGGSESFLAWSSEPLARGTEVIVMDVRGARTLAVAKVERFGLGV